MSRPCISVEGIAPIPRGSFSRHHPGALYSTLFQFPCGKQVSSREAACFCDGAGVTKPPNTRPNFRRLAVCDRSERGVAACSGTGSYLQIGPSVSVGVGMRRPPAAYLSPLKQGVLGPKKPQKLALHGPHAPIFRQFSGYFSVNRAFSTLAVLKKRGKLL